MARPKAINLDDLDTIPDVTYPDVSGKLRKSFKGEADHIKKVVEAYWQEPEDSQEGYCVWRFDDPDQAVNARMAEGAAKWVEKQKIEGGPKLKARVIKARGRGNVVWLIVGSSDVVLDRRQKEWALTKVQLPADQDALESVQGNGKS